MTKFPCLLDNPSIWTSSTILTLLFTLAPLLLQRLVNLINEDGGGRKMPGHGEEKPHQVFTLPGNSLDREPTMRTPLHDLLISSLRRRQIRVTPTCSKGKSPEGSHSPASYPRMYAPYCPLISSLRIEARYDWSSCRGSSPTS